MEGLADQSRRSQEYSDECAKCTIEMSKEVSILREKISSLEMKIEELSVNVSSRGGVSLVSVSDESESAKARLADPLELLAQGEIFLSF